VTGERDPEKLVAELDALNAQASELARRMLRVVLELDREGVWEEWGARDLPHFLSIRYGIPWSKARRWVEAAHALERLPLISEALRTGDLSLDKAVELARFATPEEEGRLLAWAQGVSVRAVRERADRCSRPEGEGLRLAEDSRTVEWQYYDGGRRFGLLADLPAAEGAVVARAIDRMARRLAAMPGEEHPCFWRHRRADALVALCSGEGPHPTPTSVVLHLTPRTLAGREHGELEGGGVVHPETASRLLCHARVRWVEEDEGGNPLRVWTPRRVPPAWMLRHLRYRDRECRFPGCGARRYLVAHHIRWWGRGGRTELDNLVLVCTFHHKLVHERGWRLTRKRTGEVLWFRPSGRRYRAGPGPGGPSPPGLPGGPSPPPGDGPWADYLASPIP
jgi:hypothetical protein